MRADSITWEEITYLCHTLGYSLIKSAPNFIGKLKPSQMHALFNGLTSMKEREADAVKKSSANSGGRQSVSSMSDLRKVPGVKVEKRK